jgi:hypothetical protein
MSFRVSYISWLISRKSPVLFSATGSRSFRQGSGPGPYRKPFRRGADVRTVRETVPEGTAYICGDFQPGVPVFRNQPDTYGTGFRTLPVIFFNLFCAFTVIFHEDSSLIVSGVPAIGFVIVLIALDAGKQPEQVLP